jgi:hypothetical protein
MKIVTFEIRGISRLSQSKLIMSKKSDRETSADFEERTWKERMHVDEDGHLFIPPMAIKNALAGCAKFLSIGVPGKGKATYTKHFEAGILCTDPIVVCDAKGKPVSGDAVQGEWLHVPSDGVRGGSKRVLKCFPYVESGWRGKISLIVVDDMITPPVLKLHLVRTGQFIGLGRFRPRNNGYYGRFTVHNIEWADIRDDLDDELDEAA